MPINLEVVAMELRKKYPDKAFVPDFVCDRIGVSASGLNYLGCEDFFISRKEVDDNLHARKCEIMFKALEELRLLPIQAAP